MRKFSDGSDATLGTLKRWASLLFSEKAEAFVEKKISESPHGENEEVIADETQILMMLAEL